MFNKIFFWQSKKKKPRRPSGYSAKRNQLATLYGISPRIEPLEQRLLLSVAPDLAVTAASVGAPSVEVGNGATLSVTYTVQNQGTWSATQNWTDKFYVSSKTSLDQTAVLAGSLTRSDPGFPLAIGASNTTTATLTIPNTTLLGNEYLLVDADAGNSLDESNSANNTMAVGLKLTTPNVELAVSNAAVVPNSLVAGNGASATVSWTVTNSGSETAAAGWSDGVYLASGTTVNASSVKLGEFAAPATLAAGGIYSQSETVTIPNTSLLGSEHIVIVADDSGTQAETSAASSTAPVAVSVALPATLANLQVTSGSVMAPASATVGQTIPVSWTVTNSGSGAALGAWSDTVYSSPTATYSAATAHTLGTFTALSTLAPGASYTQTQSIALGGASAGDNYILVVADSGQSQAESSYTNNLGSVAIAISEPSLAIVASSFIAPAGASLGETIPVSWSVQNTGTAAAAATWSDNLYVSNSPSFDSSAQLLGNYPAAFAGSLAAGASYNQSVEVTLPDTFTGSRYLLLVADAGGSQPVANSTPIVAASPITLSAPDLVMTVTHAPSAAILGEPFKVSWTVTDSGSVPADAAWQDSVYVSSSSSFDPATAQLLDTVNAPSSLTAGSSYSSAAILNLPSMPAGNYHLYFLADGNDDQGKLNASIENVASASITVSGPKLVVSINSAPAAAVAGNNSKVELSWTVTNNSTSDAMSDWTDYVYLSPTPTLDLSNYDVSYWSLGSFNEPLGGPLNAGASYTQTRAVTIPAVSTAGTYYLIIDSNQYGSQPVTSTAGQIADAAISLTLPSVNLVVTSATPSATTLVAGNSYTISYNVENQGSDAADSTSWSDEVYVSSKPTFDSSAVSIGSYDYYSNNSPLLPAGSYSASVDITIPNSEAAGTAYLLIVPNQSQSQGVTAANVYAAQITVIVPDVDLATAITSAPTTAQIGSTVSITWQVTNNGTDTTTSDYWYDYIYLSTSPTYDNSAIYVGSAYISSPPLPLAPGGSYTQTQDFAVSGYSFTAGSYYLLVGADAYDTQPQADSSQSVASAPITLTAAAPVTPPNVDLVVTSATAPAAAAAGQSLNVAYTVKNQGTDPTNSYWYDYAYLSNSPTVNSYSRYLTQIYEDPSALNGGASYTQDATISLPSNVLPGNEYLVFATNYDGQYGGGQSEVNYNNNTYAVPITISTPNLSVTAASFSGNPVEGNQVNVTWTVQNLGNAAASGNWYDAIYLSDSPVPGASSQAYLGEFNESANSSLASQGTYTTSEDVTLSAITTGPRYLLVVTDVNQALADSNRTNDFYAVPITLTAPNLAVSDVTVTPTSVETGNGAALNVQWTVTNTSSVNTSQSWYDEVFLSPTPTYDPSTAIELSSAASRTNLTAGASYTTDLTGITVSNRTPGSYYVLVVVNQSYVYSSLEGGLSYFSGQAESSPADNTAAVPLTLTTPGVTLAVSNPTVASSSLIVGQAVNVSFQVSNQGSETAENTWYDEVYISSDTSFDSSAQAIGFLSSKSPLAAGGSYTQSASVTVPQDLAAGQYYFYFVANADRNQAETSYTGDVSTPQPVTVNVPDLALVVNDPPTDAAPSESLSVSYTVTDTSTYDTTASGWYDYVYLSPTPTLDYSTATYLTYQFHDNSPVLTAGGSYTLTQEFTIPAGVTVGQSYYLLFIANSGQTQGVTTPSDGIAAVPVAIVATDVNLQVVSGSVTAPASASIGAPLTVGWSVENTGTDSAAGPWQDYVYLSTSNTFDATATQIDATITPSGSLPLAGGNSYNQSATFSLPAGTIPGNYYLYVMANGNGGQAEITTSDNVSAAVPITVTSPYLQVSSVTAPASVLWGSAVSVSWTVANNGAGAAQGYWDDAVYVSSDPTFNSSAQYLTSFFENQNVAPGGQYSDTETVFLRDIADPITGTAYILVVPNSGSSLQESDTSNSSGASGQFTLAAPALTVSNFTAPAAGVGGGGIPISWTVTNTSSVSAVAPWEDYVYLSPDNVYDGRAQYILAFAAPNIPLAAGASYTQSENVILPLIYAGPEYLLVVVDQNNFQPQTNAANDVAVTPIDVSAADLAVTSITAPAGANVGQPLTVSWTVANTGNGPADQPWDDAIYYSTKSSYDSSATLLTTVPAGGNSPLAAGDSYTQSATVTLPTGVSSGTYYFIVYTNVYDQQPEINLNDNAAASSGVAVTGPDLTVNSVTAPASANFGQTVMVDWTVLNSGDGAATDTWTDGIYFSAKSTFDNTAVLLEDVPVGNNSPLPAGASYTQSTDVTLPLTVQSANGTFYLFVVANDQAQQAVTDTTNNVSAAQAVAVTLPPLPDLVPTSLSLPATGYNGQQALVSWYDANNGTAAAAGPWTDNIYLASDAQGDNKTLVGKAAYPDTIDAGQQSPQLTQPIDLPSTPGTYYLMVVADAAGINEGPNTANNTVVDSTPITVVKEPLPDLVVTGIIPPGNGVLSGTTVPVTYTVTNQGDAPTNATQWLDAVFLSQSSSLTLSGNDFNDGYEILTQPLGVPVFATNPSYLLPGGSYSQTVNVPIPVSASGTWYVYAVTNRSFFHSLLDNFIDTGPVAESNSINDMSASAPFTVAQAPLPDLSVAPVQTPPEAFSGQPLTVSWTVANQGLGIAIGQPREDVLTTLPITPAAPAASTWTDEVFMSPDPTLDGKAVSLGTFQHSGALDSGDSYTDTEQLTLPVGVTGNFYFIVQTDVAGQVFEGGATADEVNSTPTAITVNLTPPPDLQASVQAVPSNAVASHTLTFTYQVSNIGAGPTAPVNSSGVWTDAFYLSPTPAYNAATAVSLGMRIYNGNLAAGGSYQDTITETVPNALSGRYYLIVDADSANSVFELDQTSKFAASASPIQVASEPADLVVTAASGPATGQAGGAVMVDWTIVNQGVGDTAVTTWADNVYVEDSATLDSNGILLGSFTHVGLLAAGGSYSQSQLVTLPISLSGPYNLFVVTNEPILIPGQSTPPPPVYESNFNNDISSAVPVNVVQALADLQATSVDAPATVEAGSTVSVQWTVKNNGAAATNSDYWFDDIWLSTKTTLASGGTDVYLGTVQHTNALAAGGSYTASDMVTVPADLPPGNYDFIVAVDRPLLPPGIYDPSTVNRVYESNENNNETASAVKVEPGPELVTSQVTAPSIANVDQSITVGWTVTNAGAGGTGNFPIQDSVYLSYDQVFSNSSIYVGSATYTGGLAAGGSYTQSATLTLPTGREGTFYVFVVADTNQNVYEQNASDPVAFDATPLVIQPTPPADLVAGTVTIPANAVPGQDITITYQVANNGANPANGSWTDSLYLSPTPTFSPGDPLLGTVAEDRDLLAGGSYTATLTAPLPGVDPGSYYVILQTNILNTIPETTLSNNLSASLTQTSVAVPALTLGVPSTGTLGSGLSAFYQVAVAAGDTLQINFTSSEAASLNELYVTFGSMPSRAQADYSFQQLAANQTITVPATQAGTYYILAYANAVPNSPESYSMTAAIIPFSVTAVSPDTVGNAGSATIEISGADYDRDTTFALAAPGGATIPAASTFIQNASTAWVTFSLAGAAAGSYGVIATAGNQSTAELSDALTITAGTGGNLQTSLEGPASVLVGRVSSFNFVYSNTGDANIGAPLVFIESPSGTLMGLTAAAVPYNNQPIFLANNSQGPAGVLPPGSQGTRTIYFQAPATAGAPNSFQYTVVSTDNTQPISWSQVVAFIAPSYLESSKWAAASALLQQWIGGTWGGFVQLLDENAPLVVPATGDPSLVGGVLDIAVQKAMAAAGNSISGSLEAQSLSMPVSGVTVFATNTATGTVTAAESFNDGSFIFQTLAPGNYQLSVAGAIVVSGGAVTVAAGQAVGGVTLGLSAGADISGQIFGQPSNESVPGATLMAINQADSSEYTATSGADGNFNISGLPPGIYDLIVNATGYAQAEFVGVDVTHANAIETVTLAAQSTISGNVILGSGGPGEDTLQVTADIAGSTDPMQNFLTSSTLSSFTLGGLPAGTYNVTLTLPGYIQQTISNLVVPASQAVSLGNITFAPASEIDGTVTSDDPNNPAAQTLIQAIENGTVVGSAIADASGNFQILNLPPGTYTLAGPLGVFVTTPTLTVALGQTVTGESVVFQPGGTISGTATSSGNAPLAGIPVYLSGPNGLTESTVTSTNGTYQFSGLNTGSYEVYLPLGGTNASQTVSVTSLAGTAVTANLQLPYSATVTGTVTDGSGNPIANGNVTIYQNGAAIATAQTNASGAYEFLIVQPGTFDLAATAPDGTFTVVTGLVVNSGSTVTQNFQAGNGSVAVSVTDGNQVVGGDTVSLEALVEGTTVIVGQTTIATSGTATFSGLAAGNYTVLVTAADGDAGQSAASIAEGGSANAAVSLTAQADASGTVTGSTANPLSGASVIFQLSSDLQQGYTATTASDGTYSIIGLAPGTYDVTVFANGYLANTQSGVVVSTTATVNASLTKSTTTINGTLVDSSGHPVPGGTVAIFDAAGHLLGYASVNPNGVFSITSATGNNLMVQASVPGYAPGTAVVNVAAGSTTQLNPLVLQAVAIDPNSGAGQGSQGALYSDGQAWADMLAKQAEGYRQTPPGPPSPPSCPDCDGKYQLALGSWQDVVNQAKIVNDQVNKVEAEQYAMTAALGADAGVITAIIEGAAYATVKAVTPIVAKYLAPVATFWQGAAVALSTIATIGSTVENLAMDLYNIEAATSYDQILQINAQGGADATKLLSAITSFLNGLNIPKAIKDFATLVGLAGPYGQLTGALGNMLSSVSKIANGPFTFTVYVATRLQGEWDDLNKDTSTYYNALSSYNTALDLLANCNATATCNQPNPWAPPGSPSPHPVPGYYIPPSFPHDPNNIIGPAGFGSENYVPLDETLPYTIDFENEPTAGLPAQQVTVTQQLDSNLNWQSFRLGSFGFGGTTYSVPANTAFYQTQIDLSQSDGFDVDVIGTINEQTGVATWTFTTIDPSTGQIPLDPSVGFLPPDNSSGAGEGFVSYTVTANRADTTGTVINAQATVDFYTQPPIDTQQIFNTIDAGSGLTSAVAALPAVQTSSTFNLSWSGTDNSAGSAINNYTIYVSDDGGPFTPWLQDTALTSAPYTGEDGHTYAFYSVAMDNAGNVQATPAADQASTVVTYPSQTGLVSNFTNGSTYGQNVTFTATVSSSSGGTPTGSVQFMIDGQPVGSPVMLDNGQATYSLATLSAVKHTIAADYVTNGTSFSNSSDSISQTVNPYVFTYAIKNDGQTFGTPANLAHDLGATISTGVNNENLSIVYSSSGDTATAGVGKYPINGTLGNGTGLLSNYNVTLVPGTLTVTGSNQGVPATVTGISPSSGTGLGGKTVTITGTGFVGATAVDFGGVAATSFTVNSATQITATSPAGANTVDVTVIGSGGTSATSTADQFTYAVSEEIIDNTQPGFWSTSFSTWTTTTSGLNASSLVSSTPNGSKESQAAWWFSVPAGLYEISVTYTAGSNLTKDLALDLYDGVGNFIAEVPVNEQVAANSFSEDGVAWLNLGAFHLSSNIFHISTWNSSSDGAICINGIQLKAAPVVDDSDAPNSYTYYPPAASVGSFTTTGSFTTVSQGAFGTSHTSASAAGSGSSTATWTMPVTPGTYEVDATWPASSSISASATYNIFSGGTKLGAVTVNQKTSPSGISYEGINWQSLGNFTISGTQLSVTLSNTASDGQVSADAIRILPSYQPTPIVASGSYPGFWSNAAWTTQNTGLYGSSMVSNSPNGSELSQAAWWFGVQPGQYQVFVTWVPGSNLSPTTPFDIYNALTYISEPTVDEQIAPVGVTDQGVVWQSLGVFTMTSNVLHVSTWNKETNGAMNVDGIRIVPV